MFSTATSSTVAAESLQSIDLDDSNKSFNNSFSNDRLPKSFHSRKTRNKQRLFQRSRSKQTAYEEVKTPMVVIFDVVLFFQLFIKLLDFLT